jgi:uncharacterized membrane protein YkoI
MKLIATAVIAALFLTGASIPVCLTSGQGAQPRQIHAADTCLTAEEALTIALNHAGLTENQIRRLEREFDRDQGRPEWDIEFVSGAYEYSYEIHAETGAVLEWDTERED